MLGQRPRPKKHVQVCGVSIGVPVVLHSRKQNTHRQMFDRPVSHLETDLGSRLDYVVADQLGSRFGTLHQHAILAARGLSRYPRKKIRGGEAFGITLAIERAKRFRPLPRLAGIVSREWLVLGPETRVLSVRCHKLAGWQHKLAA